MNDFPQGWQPSKYQPTSYETIYPLVPAENSYTLQPEEWVIDEFVSNGLMLFAGYPGVGKTVCLVPLAMVAAGLIQLDGIMASTPRNVIYLAEDVKQVSRICYALLEKHEIDHDLFEKHFEIRQGSRSPVDQLAGFTKEVRQLDREILTDYGKAKTSALLVVDTIAATVQMDNENDNAQGSQVIAEIKEAYRGIPVWLVAHTSKASKGAEARDMTVRGASAFEGDAQGVFYLFEDRDTGSRYLYGGPGAKRRDEGSLQEIEITAIRKTIEVKDRFGLTRTQGYLVPSIIPSDANTREQKTGSAKQGKSERKKEERAVRVKADCDLVREAVAKIETLRIDDPTNLNAYPSQIEIVRKLRAVLSADRVKNALSIIAREDHLPSLIKKKGCSTYICLLKNPTT